MQCIVLERKYYLFETTSAVTTIIHLVGAITGTIIYEMTNEEAPFISLLLKINIGLLVLSGLALLCLSYMSNMFILRKVMVGMFDDPSLIAIFIEEKLAKIEYNIEKDAKKEKGTGWSCTRMLRYKNEKHNNE